ncbi:MAG: hypothetical protein QOJ85_1973 [Solirubrobacteraceae bacterium]|nr:hypothetical protein [Solirubrobacteraceae bacterium]
MRLASEGAKPAVVARWMRYWTTPRLSVAAVQLSCARPASPVAVSADGLDGGVRSVPGTGIVMTFATDGTPWPLRMKTW